ncbi:MAG: DUF2695 domain-containing protein [Planctomycetota bacterium]|jgi:hypothetical protein
MDITLTKNQAQDLISFVDFKLSKDPCDHSLRHATQWAKINQIDYDDLIDILEDNGGYCDCEVVLNLPDDREINVSTERNSRDKNNPWKIPIHFKITDSDKTYMNYLISQFSEKNKCFASEGELLVHFFIGIKTGLPNELGFVHNDEPITAKEFAKKVRDSGQKDLLLFREKEAAFFLSRLDQLQNGNAVGTHFSEITGLTSKYEELRVHKVILRKK